MPANMNWMRVATLLALLAAVRGAGGRGAGWHWQAPQTDCAEPHFSPANLDTPSIASLQTGAAAR